MKKDNFQLQQNYDIKIEQIAKENEKIVEKLEIKLETERRQKNKITDLENKYEFETREMKDENFKFEEKVRASANLI